MLHLSQTDEMAVASFQNSFAAVLEAFIEGLTPTASVDDGAGRLVEHERGAAPPDVHARWRRGSEALLTAVAGMDPHARLSWVAGDLSAQSLATTRLTEAWIHTGDILHAFGRTPEADDRLWHIARLAWRTLPYAFAPRGRPPQGPVIFELASPTGSTWRFGPDEVPPDATIIGGDALDLCLVAGQRARAADTGLIGTGPDAADILALVRTFA